jgi:hypothetical protein
MSLRRSTFMEGVTRPLRLVFRSRTDAPPAEAALDPVDERPGEVEFVAYAEDCILSGHVRLTADRLSDLVNDHDELELVDVLVSDLTGSEGIEVHQLLIRRDEILVLHATGPRGRADRRQRTRQHPIVVKLGPYVVRGYVHAIPGSDPIAGLRRRRPIVALTDAVVEYAIGREPIRRRVSTVLVNRELADWIVEGDDESDELDKFALPVDGQGLLVKDFTGEVLGWSTAERAGEVPGWSTAERAAERAGEAAAPAEEPASSIEAEAPVHLPEVPRRDAAGAA